MHKILNGRKQNKTPTTTNTTTTTTVSSIAIKVRVPVKTRQELISQGRRCEPRGGGGSWEGGEGARMGHRLGGKGEFAPRQSPCLALGSRAMDFWIESRECIVGHNQRNRYKLISRDRLPGARVLPPTPRLSQPSSRLRVE
ncbi:hypothetical protein E2C01_039556 [Portunus trituberculatus]|uniref:Uncharacterized protein n=1 Tax=Portunus trituberculatus TaxID=210409 RepID=A0A5B7FDY3_PORTR|nr:hypothetical protein [Portunus trituberculatus]